MLRYVNVYTSRDLRFNLFSTLYLLMYRLDKAIKKNQFNQQRPIHFKHHNQLLFFHQNKQIASSGILMTGTYQISIFYFLRWSEKKNEENLLISEFAIWSASWSSFPHVCLSRREITIAKQNNDQKYHRNWCYKNTVERVNNFNDQLKVMHNLSLDSAWIKSCLAENDFFFHLTTVVNFSLTSYSTRHCIKDSTRWHNKWF